MSTKEVTFGLDDVYWATIEYGSNNSTVTYGTPARIYGARAISLSKSGDWFEFPADNTPDFFSRYMNGGYEGSLTLASDDDEDFQKYAYGYAEAVTGTSPSTTSAGLAEVGAGSSWTASPKPFLLMFRISNAPATGETGTDEGDRIVFFHCQATAPDVESQTTERDNLNINEKEIPLRVYPRLTADKMIKLTIPSSSSVYTSIKTAIPAFTEGSN